MEDKENEKGIDKLQKVHFDSSLNQTHLLIPDDAALASSSCTSDSSLESTLTDKDDILPGSYSSSFDLDESVTPFCDASGSQPSNGLPTGYDPNRLPSAIFNSRPTTPMDWSVASNESLFSIHMGNNSFSRDQFMMYKSGELMKLEEVFSVPNALPPVAEGLAADHSSWSSRWDLQEPEAPAKITASLGSSSSADPSPQNSPKSESPSAGVEFYTPKAGPMEASGKSTKAAESPKVDEQHKARIPPPSQSQNDDVRRSVSTHSGESGTSTASFAFPVFEGVDKKHSLKKAETPKQSSPYQPHDQKPQPPSVGKQKPNKSGIKSCFSCCSFRCCSCLKWSYSKFRTSRSAP